MLDLQRQRYASRIDPGTHFSRAVVFAHFGFGSLAPVILLFHERFFMAVISTLWFLITVGLVMGMRHHQQWCRVCLGVAFAIGSLDSLGYLVWVVPAIEPPSEPVLTLKILPFWLTIWGLAYGVGAILMFCSKRIERSTMRGFELWSLPSR